jgi:OmpA-OmpF porin, OOP family
MSILNSLKGMLTNELVSGVAGHLGESNDGINKAMTGILPSLLGGLMNSKQEDHGMLSGLLNQAGAGGGNLVGDLLGGLTGGGNSGISGIGSSLVSGLLGNKAGGVVNLISSLAGIKSGSSSSLMNIGGSLIASFLGKKMLGDGLNFGGILNMLTGQKDEIGKAMPAGIGSALGLGNLFGNATDTAKAAVSSATSTVTNAATTITGGDDDNKSGGGMKWLWPLLLAGLLGFAAWYAMKGCKGADDNANASAEMADPNASVTTDGTATATATDAAATDANAATTATTTATDATNATAAAGGATAGVATTTESIKVKLADGIELDATKGGLEDKLRAFIEDPATKGGKDDANWFNFRNLNFETGKSSLKAGSDKEISNIVAFLKAYPKLKIKIGGYTDNVGDAAKNLKLSSDRAQTVYNAIVAAGGNKAQFVENPHDGYGQEHPIADNSTDAGKAQNRRISVCVREK